MASLKASSLGDLAVPVQGTPRSSSSCVVGRRLVGSHVEASRIPARVTPVVTLSDGRWLLLYDHTLACSPGVAYHPRTD